MTITITTQSRMFFVKSFKGLPSRGDQPGMQDWGHATPSENHSPAGKAQNCRPRCIANVIAATWDRFDEAEEVWFQGSGNLYNGAHGSIGTSAQVSAGSGACPQPRAPH